MYGYGGYIIYLFQLVEIETFCFFNGMCSILGLVNGLL